MSTERTIKYFLDRFDPSGNVQAVLRIVTENGQRFMEVNHDGRWVPTPDAWSAHVAGELDPVSRSVALSYMAKPRSKRRTLTV